MNNSDDLDPDFKKSEESLKQQILRAIDARDSFATVELCAAWYALKEGHSPPPSNNIDLIDVLGGVKKIEQLLQERLRSAFEKGDAAAAAAGQRLAVALEWYKAGDAR